MVAGIITGLFEEKGRRVFARFQIVRFDNYVAGRDPLNFGTEFQLLQRGNLDAPVRVTKARSVACEEEAQKRIDLTFRCPGPMA